MLSRVPRRLVLCVAFACVAYATTAQAETAPRSDDNQQTQFRYWTTSWSFEQIDLSDLTGKLASIGLELPIELSGTASVDFQVSIPWNALRNPKAYKFRGSLSSPWLKADKLVLQKFSASVDYSDGIATLTDLHGRQGSGSFEGSATADVVSQGPLSASLKIEQFELGPIAELLAKLGVGRDDKLATGWIDGDVKLSASLGNVRDAASWVARGNLHVRDMALGNSIPYSIAIDKFVLRDGRLIVPDASMQSSAVPQFYLRAKADISLVGRQAFAISLQADDIPLADVASLYVDSAASLISGKLDLQGQATGALKPTQRLSPAMEIQFALASPSIHVCGVDLGLLEHQLRATSDTISLQPLRAPGVKQPLMIESVDTEYQLHPQRFKMMNLDAKLFGGTISGDVEIARSASGEHSVTAAWKGLNPQIRLPPVLGTSPILLSGETTGKVKWSVPANRVEFPAFHRADVAVNVERLRLGIETLGSLDAALEIDETGFGLQGLGQLFGGRVQWTSTSPRDPTVRWAEIGELVRGGQLVISDVSVARLIEVFAQRNPRRFCGRLTGTTDLTVNHSNEIETRSRWIVREFGVDGRSLSKRLSADISTDATQINFRSVNGNYAGGAFQAAGRWSWSGGQRTIDARFVRVDGQRMLIPLHATASRWVSGKVSGRATIAGHGTPWLDDFRISGSARLADGRTFDIPIGNAHTPFRVLVRRRPLAWRADFSNVRSELAHGQVNGDLHFASAPGSRRGFNMESRWRLSHVEFEELLRTYVGTRTLGRGNVTGRFVFSGQCIRSLQDLQGDFRLKLDGIDVTAVPGLPATSSMLGLASLLGTKFNDGEAVGKIARGAVAMEQVVLLSDRLKFIGSGRVGLQDGRMDVLGIATTGNFYGQNTILEGIAPKALLSVSPVSSLDRLVNDRTVVVDMLGTLQNPQIRLRPAETFQANLREFLIRQITGQLAIESELLEIDW